MMPPSETLLVAGLLMSAIASGVTQAIKMVIKRRRRGQHDTQALQLVWIMLPVVVGGIAAQAWHASIPWPWGTALGLAAGFQASAGVAAFKSWLRGPVVDAPPET